MSKCAPLLEVIACSVADAVEARQGGASRLEIVRDLSCGGLTPPVQLVQQIISIVSIPLRVMLRESEGYEVASEAEKEQLCVAASEFSRLPIDGLVLGFLCDRRIDVKLTQQILAYAPNLKATFHHAFEDAVSFDTIRDLKTIKQVDRILAHGGIGEWSDKIERLAMYRRQSQPEIEIIAGGGLKAETIEAIRSTTEIREFHVGRAARAGETVEGVVQASRVKRLVEAAREVGVTT